MKAESLPPEPPVKPLESDTALATQCEFHVVATRKLDERTPSQHSITLETLVDLAGASVRFDPLASAVEGAAAPTIL